MDAQVAAVVIAVVFLLVIAVLLWRKAGRGRIKFLGGEAEVETNTPSNTLAGDSASDGRGIRQRIQGAQGKNTITLSGSKATDIDQQVVP